MTTQIIIIVYLVIGCGSTIAVVAGCRAEGRPVGVSAVLMVALWPFLLPAALLREPTLPTTGSQSDGMTRIAAVARAIHAAFEQTDASAGRERDIVEGFIEKLRSRERKLQELDDTLQEVAPSVRTKLETIREKTSQEIEEGLNLLEEMVAQLTLLRFAGIAESDGQGEKDSVEDLLSRIEALADLGQAA